MKKPKLKRKTFRRYLVIKGCKKDFGLGVGVLARDELTLTDSRGRGFESPFVDLALYEQAEEMMKKHVTVLIEDKKAGYPWNTNPQKKARR